jgi:putative sulfotransferase
MAGDVTASSNRFWEIIGTPYRKQNLMLRQGVAMKEVLYPCAPTSRFNAQKGVPAILQTTLPHLTQDHDRLFDEIRRFVLSRESVHIEEHYSGLFTWLQERFQRRVWVERSGSSLRIVGRLSHLFPEARFVHIVRDGRDCGLSMSRHLGFRMVLLAFLLTEILGCDPFENTDRSGTKDLPDDLYPLLPEHFDPQAFLEYEPPQCCPK